MHPQENDPTFSTVWGAAWEFAPVPRPSFCGKSARRERIKPEKCANARGRKRRERRETLADGGNGAGAAGRAAVRRRARAADGPADGRAHGRTCAHPHTGARRQRGTAGDQAARARRDTGGVYAASAKCAKRRGGGRYRAGASGACAGDGRERGAGNGICGRGAGGVRRLCLPGEDVRRADGAGGRLPGAAHRAGRRRRAQLVVRDVPAAVLFRRGLRGRGPLRVEPAQVDPADRRGDCGCV